MSTVLTLEDLAAEILALPEGEQALAAAAAAKIYGLAGNKTPEQIELESNWQNCLKTLFPHHFSSEFGDHHIKFWEWVWAMQRGVTCSPEVDVWPRGHGKSTNAEAACAMLGARGTRRYGWYLSEVQDQADDHVSNVAALLESEEMRAYYPQLGERLLNKFGTSKGWKRNRIRTATGFTVDALGLDKAKRGVKLEQQRPDFIIIDDVDGKHDSPQVTRKKIEIITTSILPAGSRDLIVLAVQNLIHKDSIFTQLVDGRADFLIKRRVQGPIPAIRDFDYEKLPPSQEFPNGRHVITSGTATWAGMDLEVCQDKIDTEGIEAFLTERQHKVDLNVPGAIFPEWSEIYHIITHSEFIRFYGEIAKKDPNNPLSPMKIPDNWNLGRGLDWGTTVGHPSACIGVARPYETHQLTHSVFVHLELTMPAFPFKSENIAPVSPRRLKKAVLKAYGKSMDKRVEMSAMSHEASAAFNTFMHDYLEDGELLWFNKWKAQTGSGVPQIQNALEIDPTQPHPFRRYPKGYKIKGVDVGGLPLQGRPRFYVIVPDDQGALFVDDEGTLRVRGAVDSRGMARLRYEFPKYRNPITAAGQEKPKPNPKAHGEDDAIDALRGLANLFFPAPHEMSADEKVEALLPDNLKLANITKRKERGEDVQGSHAARMHKVAKLQKQVTAPKTYSALAAYKQRLKNRR